MTASSPERHDQEPLPKLEDLFDAFANKAMRYGEYTDPATGWDAPCYSLPLTEEAKEQGILSIQFTTPFRDVRGEVLDASVHLVWNEGPIDKNITFVRIDDGSVDGISLSAVASEQTKQFKEMWELGPADIDAFFDILEDLDNSEVTEDELRTIVRLLAIIDKTC